MTSEHFVYVLLDDGRPFYVGQSSDERRVYAHISRAKRQAGTRPTTRTRDRTIHHILMEGRKPELRKIATALTCDEACALERKIIAEMGQLHCGTGPLVNGENVSVANTIRRALKWKSTTDAIGKAIADTVLEHEARAIVKAITAGLAAKKKQGQAPAG